MHKCMSLHADADHCGNSKSLIDNFNVKNVYLNKGKINNSLTEDEKRLYRRNQARKGNLNLNKTAVNSGVVS